MIAEAFILAWNEIETIHLTIQHYQKFCERITILDNWSDDGTREKAEEMGCNIKLFGIKGQLDDQEYLRVKNSIYRGSEAKYVIVCDCDEILWHENIRQILEQDTGNIFNTIGWDVFSNDMPKDDFLEIQTGQFSGNYCKKVIFSPDIRINYHLGCHTCAPRGRLRPSNETLILFHYHNIGGFKRVLERHKRYSIRMSPNNRRRRLGYHYLLPDEQQKREYEAKLQDAIHYRFFDPEGVDILPF